jgi:hypothetical protein
VDRRRRRVDRPAHKRVRIVDRLQRLAGVQVICEGWQRTRPFIGEELAKARQIPRVVEDGQHVLGREHHVAHLLQLVERHVAAVVGGDQVVGGAELADRIELVGAVEGVPRLEERKFVDHVVSAEGLDGWLGAGGRGVLWDGVDIVGSPRGLREVR